MSANIVGERRTFQRVMAASAGFVLLMLGALVYVCSRPQTATVQLAERHAIHACVARSQAPERSALSRHVQADACREMTKQYVHKFGTQP